MLNNKPTANYLIVGEKTYNQIKDLFYNEYEYENDYEKENIKNIKLYKHNKYGRK